MQENEDGFTEWDHAESFNEARDSHGRATAILRSISGIVSIIASSTLIWIILRSHAGLSKTYHRLLLGMSIADILFSLSAAHFNSMAPSDYDYLVWNAKGNEVTCDAQGVIRIAGAYSGLLYTCSLNLFWLAAIKYEKTTHYIRTRIEPFLHAIPIISGLIVSVVMLVREHINDFGSGSCWLPVWEPPHCEGVEIGTTPEGFEIPCGRGDNATVKLAYAFFYGVHFFPPIIISVCLGMIYRSILWREEQASRFGDIENVGSTRNEREPAARSYYEVHSDQRRVLRKAVAYSVSYFLAWIFVIIGVSFTYAEKDWPNFVWYMTVILNPLQGLFNFLIFIHPRVIYARNTKNLTLCQAFSDAVRSRGKKRRRRPILNNGGDAERESSIVQEGESETVPTLERPSQVQSTRASKYGIITSVVGNDDVLGTTDTSLNGDNDNNSEYRNGTKDADASSQSEKNDDSFYHNDEPDQLSAKNYTETTPAISADLQKHMRGQKTNE